jgi:hypothetical protein
MPWNSLARRKSRFPCKSRLWGFSRNFSKSVTLITINWYKQLAYPLTRRSSICPISQQAQCLNLRSDKSIALPLAADRMALAPENSSRLRTYRMTHLTLLYLYRDNISSGESEIPRRIMNKCNDLKRIPFITLDKSDGQIESGILCTSGTADNDRNTYGSRRASGTRKPHQRNPGPALCKRQVMTCYREWTQETQTGR